MKTLLRNAKLYPTLKDNKDTMTVKYGNGYSSSPSRYLVVEVTGTPEDRKSKVSIHGDLVFVYTRDGKRLTIRMEDGKIIGCAAYTTTCQTSDAHSYYEKECEIPEALARLEDSWKTRGTGTGAQENL